MNLGTAFVAGVIVGLKLAASDHVQNKTLIDSYYKVTATLKAEKERAYEQGYIEGKIDQTRYIFSLVDTNK